MSLANYENNKLFINTSFENSYNLNSKYIDLNDKNSSHSIIVDLIEENSTVMDVGCSYGYLGEWLKVNKNCIVYGIDNDEESLEYAKKKNCYKDLFKIDLDDPLKNKDEFNRFNKLYHIFDYVIVADVIEHMKNPTNVLLLLSQNLKFYSDIILSVPNIANIDIILNLIEGKFNYGEFGILDNSHLRFFTKNSFIDWIKSINESDLSIDFNFEINYIGNTIYISEFVKKVISEKPIIYNLIKSANQEADVLQNIFALTKIRKEDKIFGYNIRHDYKALDNFNLNINKFLNTVNKCQKSLDNLFILANKQEKKIDTLKYILKKTAISNNNPFISLDQNEAYQLYIKYNEPSDYEIDLQKVFIFNYNPKISIIVPAFNTPFKYLNKMIESVINQTYNNWELCIAYAINENNFEYKYTKNDISKINADNNLYPNDNNDNNLIKSIKLLKFYSNKDQRIKVKFLEKNYGAGGNSNKAISLTSGEYVLFLDSDDLLPAFCLFEFVKAINENLDGDFFYSDEDKILEDSLERYYPHFKPDFSIDTLRSYNYICHTYCLRKDIIDKLNGFREVGYESQDYDMVLRASEVSKKIIHIPKVLYHWRTYPASASSGSGLSNKMFLIEGAKRSIADHLKRVGLDANVENSLTVSEYKINYKIIGNPLISIIIPNKDQYDYLYKCLNSIIDKTSYKNFEIIIVENNSKENNISKYYEKIQQDFCYIKVVKWKNNFNFSKVCNYGVSFAKGEILLFLNNDTEVINEDWLSEMIQYAQRKDVGIVGAKLFHPDDSIQHAGVIIGINNFAGHMFYGYPKNYPGYMDRLQIVQNLSAVTGACLMIRKEVFIELGKFDESDTPSDDIDLCLKAREKDYLVVFTPYAMLYHKEFGTRPYDKLKEEIAYNYFRKKWSNILIKGDPYYNLNLSKLRADFAINLDEILTF
ncbi:MAG: glycosyltransferase [bacterium]